MDRRDILKRMLYPKCKTAIEFKFDTLMVNPMLSYITIQDIAELNKIATSIKYSSKPKEKYAMIDNILSKRGFKKMASGTNRVAYRHLDDYRIVLKVAIDKVGLSDNGNEYKNQQLLKPFVTKCFEVSPCGTVGLFERVVPITSREEFINISEDVFDLINNLIGKYVLEDIGEKFYMNYGLREGFGPVLLDYPYVFELDGRKLICNVVDPMEPKGYCGGEIDYDLGYNNLICKRCGKRYLATELKSEENSEKRPKIIIEGEDTIMKCVLKRGDQVISTLNSEDPVSTNVIVPKKQYNRLRAKINTGGNDLNSSSDHYRPNINNRDDIKLQARLKGDRKGKDIDKIARDKKMRSYENTERIPVSFDTNKPDKEKETVQVKIRSENNSKDTVKNNDINCQTMQIHITDEGAIHKYVDGKYILIGYTLNSNRFKYLEKRNRKLTNYERNDNKINNENTDNISSNKQIKDEDNIKENSSEEPIINEEITEPTEVDTVVETIVDDTESSDNGSAEPILAVEAEIDNEHIFGTSIGEILKRDIFNGNDNYKTSGVVSPIDSHFHNTNINTDSNKNEEESDDNIPEVIIHPRKDLDENNSCEEKLEPGNGSVETNKTDLY